MSNPSHTTMSPVFPCEGEVLLTLCYSVSRSDISNKNKSHLFFWMIWFKASYTWAERLRVRVLTRGPNIVSLAGPGFNLSVFWSVDQLFLHPLLSVPPLISSHFLFPPSSLSSLTFFFLYYCIPRLKKGKFISVKICYFLMLYFVLLSF